jgi:hypothetical protein
VDPPLSWPSSLTRTPPPAQNLLPPPPPPLSRPLTTSSYRPLLPLTPVPHFVSLLCLSHLLLPLHLSLPHTYPPLTVPPRVFSTHPHVISPFSSTSHPPPSVSHVTYTSLVDPTSPSHQIFPFCFHITSLCLLSSVPLHLSLHSVAYTFPVTTSPLVVVHLAVECTP